ncbi:MAG: hypothetical protein KDB66_00850 [Solirubrobacterales bacterium]|nr:hypothetical protein [Solirubrobacterales bacterium]MCB8915600.1 hypothetical protein [Thermoleophilales bacterium]
MSLGKSKEFFVFGSITVLSVLLIGLLLMQIGTSNAADKCFGKSVDRVITGSHKKVTVGAREVVRVEGNGITVVGKAFTRICAGDGPQTIFAGKGWSFTDGGPGNDRIHPAKGDATVYGGPGDDQIETEKGNKLEVHGGPGDDKIRTGKGNLIKIDGDEGDDRISLNAKTTKGIVDGGLGNDRIEGSQANDKLYGGPKKNPKNLPDRDVINGLGGNDSIYDYSGNGNRLLGYTGSDKIYSLGNAVSELHGGNGSDFLYSNGGRTSGGVLEKLFGEQGNDRLLGNQPNSYGPAYFDGGEGDDWIYGTSKGDTMIYNSGIKTVYGYGGDDLFVTTARGQGKFHGGDGRDTISFAAHTPSGRSGSITGVEVNLRAGTSLGYSGYKFDGIEDVIGSAFDDEIIGAPGVDNDIEAGLGDDYIVGQNGDNIDGGLGQNDCSGGRQVNCNENSPGDPGSGNSQVDITKGGLLIVMGSRSADDISIGYNGGADRFEVTDPGGAIPSGLCKRNSSQKSEIDCPVDPNNLNGMLVYGDDGADSIKLGNSIPDILTTTINGGRGKNSIQGGPSKDFISTDPGSAGSTINGGDGLDVLYAQDDISITGGPDTDIFRVVDPCLGADLEGDGGTDSVVFAGAERGVKASLAGGYAEWNGSGCSGARTQIANDIEKLEGTESNDWLIVGKRSKAQDGKSVIFGRGGIDTLDAKNGTADTVTTGSGGHSNKVIADKIDNVIWGYGLAGH